MAGWTSDELNKIAEADELRISSRRSDGSLRNPVTIWVVRLGDDLFVRSVNGRTSHWFRGTRTRMEGHVQAGGVSKDVIFEDADPILKDRIDAAYREKYHHYAKSIVDSIVAPGPRAATVKLVAK